MKIAVSWRLSKEKVRRNAVIFLVRKVRLSANDSTISKASETDSCNSNSKGVTVVSQTNC